MPPKTFLKGSSPILDSLPFLHGLESLRHKANLCAEEINTTITELTFIYIREGKFTWKINGKSFILLTEDLLFLRPGDTFCTHKRMLEQGQLQTLHLEGECLQDYLDLYSQMEASDRSLICSIFQTPEPAVVQGFKSGKFIFDNLIHELEDHELGYKTRILGLIDELLISSARSVTSQAVNPHDFPSLFEKLDTRLRENLSHPWTVKEMASGVGLRATAFTEKLKFFTGFAPLQYLINLRVSESMNQLGGTNHSLTQIALETGFYSSQHFSSTFKKVTGYSPSKFRLKKHRKMLKKQA
ncbi:helix-turn-helix transcriptional regulator [Jiulongibacter sediminis]|uniref:helix-turn-helix transcriptional regulator n=1 Tax=Jiulongibacter sediminis TaxID=1605367 RepID=UPI0006DCA8C9|nr:AraC family transcriptional regulator [Jiulongibacter sediminis]